jgi:hypothetical protein
MEKIDVEKKNGNETKMSYKVYDLPVEVWAGLVSYARVHYEGGGVAKAIIEGFELLMEREKELHEAIPQKLMELEARIAELEKPKEKEPEDNSIRLLGGNRQ